jgi:hypothetical protein
VGVQRTRAVGAESEFGHRLLRPRSETREVLCCRLWPQRGAALQAMAGDGRGILAGKAENEAATIPGRATRRTDPQRTAQLMGGEGYY